MSDKIIVKLNEGRIVVKFGEQGLQGPAGTTDHTLLANLDYDQAGHTNFQKKLTYILEYKCYEVE
jgi:hypothetical protein